MFAVKKNCLKNFPSTFLCDKRHSNHGTFLIAATVLEESWCWQNETLELQVSETDTSDLQFVQSGYILKCILSHNITLVCYAV